MAAEEPAPPAAPVPADPAKPQKKRSPNRLVVEEALNDDNSAPRLQHELQHQFGKIYLRKIDRVFMILI